jgi:hypothetical protein
MTEYKIVFFEGRGYTVETKHERGGYQYSPYFKNECKEAYPVVPGSSIFSGWTISAA